MNNIQNINSANSYQGIGGLVGVLNTGTISNCHYTGNSNVGDFIGFDEP